MSLSSDGLSDACTAGASGENAPAKTEVGTFSTSVVCATRDRISRTRSRSPVIGSGDPGSSRNSARELMPPPQQTGRPVRGEVIEVEDDEDVEMRTCLPSYTSSVSFLCGSALSIASGTSAKRDGRGRPPTHGNTAGLSRARKEIQEKKAASEIVRQRKRLASEHEHWDEEEEGREADREKRRKRQARREFFKKQSASNLSLNRDPLGDLTIPEVMERVAKALGVVDTVATKSGNLKGNYVKVLKDVISTVSDAVVEVNMRAERDDEVGRVSRQVTRFREENKRLHNELQELKEELYSQVEGWGLPLPDSVTLGGARA